MYKIFKVRKTRTYITYWANLLHRVVVRLVSPT
jgi:hypothetical protein